MKKIVSFSASLILSLLAHDASAQTAVYWDNNGTSAASSGTWDTTTANWTSSATLTASTVAYGTGTVNFPIFAAGSGTTTTMTITVPGVVNCEGFGDGTTDVGGASGATASTLIFSGPATGAINLPAGTWSSNAETLARH